MIFSKTTEYAIRILTYMQVNEKTYYSAKTIHEELDLPYKYVTKLMTSLSKEKLIKSQMGRMGGFYLAKSPKKIFLKDIIKATHDFKKLHSCVLGHSKCSDKDPCSMHHQWVPIKEEIVNLVQTLTLEELGKMDISKL